MVGRYNEAGSLWWEFREEGSGQQTGPEGKARIGVISAETEWGYSSKQMGEPGPELQVRHGAQRAKGAVFWPVSQSQAGVVGAPLLPWEISSFKAGPGRGRSPVPRS